MKPEDIDNLKLKPSGAAIIISVFTGPFLMGGIAAFCLAFFIQDTFSIGMLSHPLAFLYTFLSIPVILKNSKQKENFELSCGKSGFVIGCIVGGIIVIFLSTIEFNILIFLLCFLYVSLYGFIASYIMAFLYRLFLDLLA